jgi:hypothetical protein
MSSTLIVDSRHPLYTFYDFQKFRLTYQGGRPFIERFLEKFSFREDDNDFKKRKCLAHNPGFAAEAIDEVKNSIIQRMGEITRTGGTESYMKCLGGELGGVDLEGSSMNSFNAKSVLPELLSMGRIGVYVDSPDFRPDETMAAYSKEPHPYLYTYRYEDILNWDCCYWENELIYNVVLLREYYYKKNEAGLPSERTERFRLVYKVSGGVKIDIYEKFFDPETRQETERVTDSYFLEGFTRIPFVMYDIGASLLNDTADYQIGLLNLASSDLAYALHSNFPFYVEGYDPKVENTFGKEGPVAVFDSEGNATEKQNAESGDKPEVVVGTMHGRRYPMEAKPPMFINPSSEPLTVSMAKQEQMERAIRRLTGLAVANVAPTRASGESKVVDRQGVESGLSNIGVELQGGEREISVIWAMYERKVVNPVISYPKTYSLKTDEQRLAEAKEEQTLQGAAPSKKFQKLVAKKIARTLLEGKISQEDMLAIEKEIEDAQYMTSDWQAIKSDYELGLVEGALAAEARGYPPESFEKAQAERTERLKQIAISQSAGAGSAAAVATARGGEGADTAKDEKTISQIPEKKNGT